MYNVFVQKESVFALKKQPCYIVVYWSNFFLLFHRCHIFSMSGKHEFGVTELVSSPRRISRFSNGLERAEEMEEDQELVEMGMHREDDVVIKEPKGKGVLEEDHTVKRQPYKVAGKTNVELFVSLYFGIQICCNYFHSHAKILIFDS